MQAIFAPTDTVVLGRLNKSWENVSQNRDHAIHTLREHQNTPNIYFRASAHDGTSSYGKNNCIRVQAFFLDIDYGTDGHRKANPFRSMDDAAGYLLTMPIRASVAWHTGHGVQACYLLKQPYLFPLGGGDALSMARYEEVSRKLSKMAMSDSTFTAEHAFRVPLTLNDKREKDPNLAVVRGSLL